MNKIPIHRWMTASKLESLRRQVVTMEAVLSETLDILEGLGHGEKVARLKRMLDMGVDERTGKI